MAAAGEDFDNLEGEEQVAPTGEASVDSSNEVTVESYESLSPSIKQQLEKLDVKKEFLKFYSLSDPYPYIFSSKYFDLLNSYVSNCASDGISDADREAMAENFSENANFVQQLLSKEISLENINTVKEIVGSSDDIVAFRTMMTNNYPNCWTRNDPDSYKRHRLLGNPSSPDTEKHFTQLFFDYPIAMYMLLFIKTLYFRVTKKTTLPRPITELSILDFSGESTESVNETLATIRGLMQEYISAHDVIDIERMDKIKDFNARNRVKMVEIVKKIYKATKTIVDTLGNYEVDISEPKVNAILKSLLVTDFDSFKVKQFGNETDNDIANGRYNNIVLEYFTSHLDERVFRKIALDAGENVSTIDVTPRSLFYIKSFYFRNANPNRYGELVDTTPEQDNSVATLRYFSFKDAVVSMLENFKESTPSNKFETFTKLPVVKQKAYYTSLFNVDSGKIKVSEFEKLYVKPVVTINTTKDVSNSELFYDKDIEEFDVEGDDIVKKTQMVSRQVLEQMIPSTTPYFAALNVKFDTYGIESGFDTGPTKQIMFYLAKMLEYMIRRSKDDGGIEFVLPKWLGTGDIITNQYCTFLTHYFMIDLQRETSTFKFPMDFGIIIPGLIGCLESDDAKHRFKINRILNDFKQFTGLTDDKLFDESGNAKYDSEKKFATREEYILHYNKICLYMINDLMKGGKQYNYLQDESSIGYTIDPENEFLEGAEESYNIPKGFLDFTSLYIVSGSKKAIDELLLRVFININTQKTITSDEMINAIQFRNDVDPKYDYLNDYMKKFLTNYIDGLDEATVKSIQEDYPTHEDFLEAFLLAWTASTKIGSGEKLKFIVSQQPNLNIATCFNQLLYPIPYGVPADHKVEYGDFVSVILGGITGVGFGLSGGYRKNLKRKHRKGRKGGKGKKSTRKHNKHNKSKSTKGKKHTRKHRK